MTLYDELFSALEPRLGARTRLVFEEGKARFGFGREDLTPQKAEAFLKQIVFRELQRVMTAQAARRLVGELLERVSEGEPQAPDEGRRRAVMTRLEAAMKRFGLYIDWPEVQRLRRLVRALATGWDEAQAEEALELVGALEEELASRLLEQAREIAEIEAIFERVKQLGGSKVRRLSTLLKMVREAQEEEILASAEVEQARALATELLKLIESSVVEAAPGEVAEDGVEESFEFEIDLEALTPEQVRRLEEIDRAEEARRLEKLEQNYRSVLTGALADELASLRRALEGGTRVGEALQAFEARLEEAKKEALAEARVKYEWMLARARELASEAVSTERIFAQLEAIREALDAGALPEGIAEVEAEIERMAAEAQAHKQSAQAAKALAERARRLVSDVQGEVDGAFAEGIAEKLDTLLHQASEGQVEAALLAEIQEELSSRAPGRAKALRAEAMALPDLPGLAGGREEILADLQEGQLEAAEAKLSTLKARARDETRNRLLALVEQVRRYGLDEGRLNEALAELDAGRIPDLAPLEALVSEGMARAVREAKRRLGQLRAEAERFRGLGGESVLEQLEALERQLPDHLPDFSGVEEAIEALRARREALRQELKARLSRLADFYDRHRNMTSETRARLGVQMRFLEAGRQHLDRLGVRGLLALEQALGEAEALAEQLAREHQAARELATALKGVDLENWLGVFEPRSDAGAGGDGLEGFRIRGVEAVARFAGGVWREGDAAGLDGGLYQGFKRELAAFGRVMGGEPRLVVLQLGERVWVARLGALEDLVLLAERPLLSRILTMIEAAGGGEGA